ncbi:MAG: hypothetical protein PUP92_21255 [Rhizonema sp. PD38]|nr:hypothetical protein [Rhizonema sp. PD38]
MNKNRSTQIDSRIQEIINQLEPVASQNRLVHLEPPTIAVTYAVQPEEGKSRKKQ